MNKFFENQNDMNIEADQPEVSDNKAYLLSNFYSNAIGQKPIGMN